MAQVTVNPNGTFTVALSEKEVRATTRHGGEQNPVQLPAKVLEILLTDTIKAWQADFYAADGPTRLVKFSGLTVQKQDQVDRILAGG
jgi:hypothetical protein